MSDQNRKVKPEGSSWNLRMTARSRNRLGGLKPDMVLDRARAALRLCVLTVELGPKAERDTALSNSLLHLRTGRLQEWAGRHRSSATGI